MNTEDGELSSVRRNGKSEAAFRTISEVADELDVPQHVLRFWETKFPQVRPLKRGGGRRYYRPEDVALLRKIQRLLYSEGYTIKGVQRLHREQGVRRLILAAGAEAEPFDDTAHLAPLDLTAPQTPPEPVLALVADDAAPTAPQEQLIFQQPDIAPMAELRRKAPLLTQAARARLTHVLGDLESVRSRIDRLLTPG